MVNIFALRMIETYFITKILSLKLKYILPLKNINSNQCNLATSETKTQRY